MSTFGGMYFTNKGRALQAKALTGVQLNFTRIAVGDGNLSGQAIQELNALIHEVKSIPIIKLKNSNDGKATIGGTLTNQGLATGFYYRELGLFAQDPTLGEILYCYGNAAALAEYIPADGGADIIEKQINIVAIVGDATNVSATLNSLIQVSSVNDKTGDVVLSAGDIKAADGTTLESFKTSVASDLAGKVSQSDYVKAIPYAVATGGANTYAVTLNPAPTSYVDGMGVVVKINIASTGASTLNVNNLGAKSIKDSLGNAITSGGLKANTPYTMRYESTSGSFIVQGKGGGGNAVAGDLLSGKTATVDSGQITGTLALTGTATASDVVNGKTFYNTDAKIKLTGTHVEPTIDSLGGTRYATGTSATSGSSIASISGLTFKPRTVIVQTSARFYIFNSDYSTTKATSPKVSSGDWTASVSIGGFSIGTNEQYSSFTYWAYE